MAVLGRVCVKYLTYPLKLLSYVKIFIFFVNILRVLPQ